MPDDAKPQTPLDLTLDFESFATKPATPPATGGPAKPIDLDWDEATPPALPPAVPPAVPTVAPRAVPVVPVADLPEAVPVVVPRAARPAVAPGRPMQANPSREFAKERPATKRTVLAVVVVLGLMAATAVAMLVLLYAIYVGFKAFGTPKSGPTTPATRRAV